LSAGTVENDEGRRGGRPRFTMSRSVSSEPSDGWVTLALTFAFLLLFRVEQNVAYVLGLSTRELVTLDTVPANGIVQVFAPYLHANAGHLVSTLVWCVPFGYALERRRPWQDYLGFVVVSGLLTNTLVPVVLVVLGIAPGLGVGGSGITHALVGREATARIGWLRQPRSLDRMEGVVLVVVVVGFLVALAGLLNPPSGARVGHATGLVVGVAAAVGERYVSVGGE